MIHNFTSQGRGIRRGLTTAVLFLLVVIHGAAQAQPGTLDITTLHNYANQEVPAYITRDNTTGNPITDEGATLGRVLFYDRRLSNDDTISCASCHQQQFAFSDTAELSEGVDGLTQRHSMRLINTRFQQEHRYRWDESAESLEMQMTLPIHNQAEMGFSGNDGQPEFSALVAKLEATEIYPELFTLVFGDPSISENRIQLALAQFVRSIQSFDSKYDAGRALVPTDLEDFPNFTENENAGKRLFIEMFTFEPDTITVDEVEIPVSRRTGGGLNCATCHRPPEFDIDPASRNNGFIRVSNPGPGNRNDTSVTRSPSIRDLVNPDGEINGGMFHLGETDNLGGMVGFYDFRQPQEANDNLDPRYLPGGLPQWLNVTPGERNQLIAFLRTLSGTQVYFDEKWADPFDESGNLVLSDGTIFDDSFEILD